MHKTTLDRYAKQYASALAAQTYTVDASELPPIETLIEAFGGIDRPVKVLPAKEYMRFGAVALMFWGNKAGVFSVPTTELAAWLGDRHPGEFDLHEIGAGNAALAKFRGHKCSDSRQNRGAQAIAQRFGVSSAKTPTWVSWRTGNMAAAQYRPRAILAQWVTPGSMTLASNDGCNSYGPDYAQILENCGELIFIGNDGVHGMLENILPEPSEVYRPWWLLSRSVNPDGNFIKIWRGDRWQHI